MSDFDDLTLRGASMLGGLRYHRGDEAKVLADHIAFWRVCWGWEPSEREKERMRRDLAAARAVYEKERDAPAALTPSQAHAQGRPARALPSFESHAHLSSAPAPSGPPGSAEPRPQSDGPAHGGPVSRHQRRISAHHRGAGWTSGSPSTGEAGISGRRDRRRRACSQRVQGRVHGVEPCSRVHPPGA